MYSRKGSFLLLVFLVMLIVVLSGCGGDSGTEVVNGGGNSNENASNDNGNASNQDAEKESVTLSIFVNSGTQEIWESEDALGKLITDYEQESGNIVELNIIPGDNVEAYKKIDISLVSGDHTDLVLLSDPLIQQKYSTGGFLLSLNELMEKNNYDAEAVFGPNLQKFDDSVYFLPSKLSQWAVFYNKKIFDDAGVPYPSGYWTWSDYIETAKQLNDPQKGIMGSYMLTFDAYLYATARQKDVSGYKEDGLSNYDHPAFKEALQFFGDLGNVHEIQPSWMEWQTKKLPNTGFMNGTYGLQFIGSWYFNQLNNAEVYPRDWDWGITQVPVPDDGSGDNNLGIVEGLGINKNSRYPDEAFDFLTFFAENAYAYTGTLPARVDLGDDAIEEVFRDIAEKSNGSVTVDDLNRALIDNGLGIAQEKIVGPAMIEYSNIILQEGELYLVGQQSLEDSIKNIKERADEAIIRELEEN